MAPVFPFQDSNLNGASQNIRCNQPTSTSDDQISEHGNGKHHVPTNESSHTRARYALPVNATGLGQASKRSTSTRTSMLDEWSHGPRSLRLESDGEVVVVGLELVLLLVLAE